MRLILTADGIDLNKPVTSWAEIDGTLIFRGESRPVPVLVTPVEED